MVDRSSYSHLSLSDEKDAVFSQKIEKENYYLIGEKLDTSDLHILEPLIQNPRMRVQHGCFMFFPFRNVNDEPILDLTQYNSALDKWINQSNADRSTTLLRHKDVCKKSKKAILIELEEEHGISKATVFLEKEKTKEARKIYTQLYFEATAQANNYLKTQDNQT